MSQFLYRIQPARPGMLTEAPTEHEAQVLGEHFAYLSTSSPTGAPF